jgi:RNA-splicing ligase RtcB
MIQNVEKELKKSGDLIKDSRNEVNNVLQQIEFLEGKHDFISEENSEFGLENGRYDFKKLNIQDIQNEF